MSYKAIRKEKPLVVYYLYVRYNGERYRKRLKCLPSMITQIHNHWLKQVFSGELSPRAPKSMKFNAAFEEYLQWSKSRHSRGHYVRTRDAYSKMKRFLKNKDIYLEAMTRNMALSFLDWVKQQGVGGRTLSIPTVNKYSGVWHAFYEWARERELMPNHVPNPFRKTLESEPARKEMILLNVQQIGELFSACHYPHQITFLLLALTTGMRHGELLSLEWKDVHLDKSMIMLDPRKTKTGKSRVLPLIEFVAKYLRNLPRDCTHVISFMGRRIVTFRKSWMKIKIRLSWDASELRIHDLRHNCATFLKVAGVPMYLISRLLGHADTKMTERYSVISDEAFNQEVGKLSGLLSEKLANICPTDIIQSQKQH